MSTRVRRVIWIGIGMIALVAIVVSSLPKPVLVDTAQVQSGPMSVAIQAEGVTRVHNLYTITAPVSGRVGRLEFAEGDSVVAGAEVARMYPLPLDNMQRLELEARIEALESGVQLATADVGRVKAELEQARKEMQRMEQLAAAGAVALQQREQAQTAVKALEQQLAAAQARQRSAQFEKEVATVGRMAYTPSDNGIPLKSPVSGRLFRIPDKSERAVSVGTPLLIIGDPTGLEVVVDVLSTDAVSIAAGDSIIIAGWGGEDSLAGRVRYIQPSAFTKISALGIEEQRVNIVGEITRIPRELGDGYRIVANIITWQNSHVIKAPASALFRNKNGWSVYVIDSDGKARQQDIQIGHRNAFEVEVIAGLEEGDRLILHPSSQIQDGVDVEERDGNPDSKGG